MSKDNRNIVRAPRIHGRMVTDEDQIEQLLSPAQGEKLLESGALTGNWEFEGDGQEETRGDSSSTDPHDVAEKEFLRDKLQKSEDFILKVRGENGDLLSNVRTLKSENQRLTAKAEASAESFDRLGVVHDDNVRELKKSQSEVERLKTENANVKRELQEALKKAQVELDNEKAEFARLTAENETLRADLEKAQKPKASAK